MSGHRSGLGSVVIECQAMLECRINGLNESLELFVIVSRKFVYDVESDLFFCSAGVQC